MFRVGEFSKLAQVSIRMLRYYDEAGLLKPAQVEPFTGYRNYTAEQIPTLQKIIMLRDLGYSVSEIATALSAWDNDFLASNLTRKRIEVENTIKLEQERLAKINAALLSIDREDISRQYNFILKQIPCYSVISLRRILPDYFCEGELWQALSDLTTHEAVAFYPNADNFAIYHDLEFKETDVDVEVCAVVKKLGVSKNGFIYRQTEAVELMACAMVYGAFENIKTAYLSFAHWLTDHSGYTMSGKNRQICHRGPWDETLSEHYLTEIQIPLVKK